MKNILSALMGAAIMTMLIGAGDAAAAERGRASAFDQAKPFSPAPPPATTTVTVRPQVSSPSEPAPMIRHDPAVSSPSPRYRGPAGYAGPAPIESPAAAEPSAPLVAPLAEDTPAPPRKRPRRAHVSAESESNESGLPPPPTDAPIALPTASATPFPAFVRVPENGDLIEDIIKQIYTARNYAPLWLENGQPTARANAVMLAMAGAASEGLNPADYDLISIQAMVPSAAANPSGYDLALSRAVLKYGRDLMGGRLAALSANNKVRIGPAGVDPAIMAAALTAADPVMTLHDRLNRNPAYQALLPQLAVYRTLVANGGWAAVPDGRGKLEPGETSDRVPAIRARLAITDGPIATPVAGAENIYDDDLKNAVIRFQSRHGLISDGVIGSKTLSAMNTSAATRLMQIAVTLERLRVAPEAVTDPYVMVNIPGFYLQVVQNGQKIEEMGVVTGRPARATPQFAGEIFQVVLNPPWGVPAKLAREDILPKLQRNPAGLEASGFRVYDRDGTAIHPTDIDWSNYSAGHFPFSVRQAPGDDNALGLMKLNIRNDFDIYLHDTHDRHLFARDLRAYSSGCIRMSRPLDMITWALSSEEGWDRGRIEGVLGGSTRYIDLKNRRPMVYVKYMTAWMLPDGRVSLRDDEYGQDKRIADLLNLEEGAKIAAD